MNASEKEQALSGVTGAAENWGSDPFFVMTSHANSQWKKVLLINTGNNVATFRSITHDPNYMPKIALRAGTDWWLDNYMLDISIQEMSILYKALASYCENLNEDEAFAPE